MAEIDKMKVAQVLVDAMRDAEFGEPSDPVLMDALGQGDFSAQVDVLEFDSLQAMEFCISIELATGAPITAALVEDCKTFDGLAAWIWDHASDAFRSSVRS